jgi:hypothetical protein
MAKNLKSYEFASGGGRQKYPWEQWFNGDIWELTDGDDFQCNIATMRMQTHKQAKARGLRVKTAVDGGRFILQAFKEGETPAPAKKPAKKSSKKKAA